MAVIKSLKKEVKVAAAAPAPEIFFRIYILIQSGFSLYCRVLILQWCPKKFVGKEKKFQGFHYCQKVDKKGREIYTQFPTTHCTLWFDPIGFQHWRIREALIRLTWSVTLWRKASFARLLPRGFFFPEASVKFNRQDERKNCTENGEFLSQLLSQIRFEVFLLLFTNRPVSAQSQLSNQNVNKKRRQNSDTIFVDHFR